MLPGDVFPQRMAWLINNLGLKDEVADVSRKIGVSPTQIRRWIAGESVNPTLSAIHSLSVFFEVSPTFFFDTEEGDPARLFFIKSRVDSRWLEGVVVTDRDRLLISQVVEEDPIFEKIALMLIERSPEEKLALFRLVDNALALLRL